MKRIDTLIHPPLWEQARSVLEDLGARVTLREVKTFGRTPPKREVYRGSAYYLDVTPELELTAIVEDEQVEGTIAALEAIGREGEIVVSAVDEVVCFGEQPRVVAVSVPTAAIAKQASTIPLRTASVRA